MVVAGGGGKLRSAPVRYKYVFLLTLLLAGSFLLLTITNGTELFFLNNEQALIATQWERHYYQIDNIESRYTIKTEGCTIPGLQPLDESIKKFVKTPTRIKTCPNSNSTLLSSNETHIWIVEENLEYYHVREDSNLTCCYLPFYRPASVRDIASSNIDDRVQYRQCSYFDDVIEVNDEFVRVICFKEQLNIYDQFFLFAFKKPFVINDDDFGEPPHNQSYNVVIMGIDAVSRLNFHRTMPKTLTYLKNKGAIELLGYNKVGDNTFPNLIPMLLGIRDVDLKKTCWPNSRRTFDNCPFVWDRFRDAGYYTALGEDSGFLGTFNYQKIGFSDTPTDYYLHTFIHEAEDKTGKVKDFNSYLCMGDTYFYRVLLDYIEKLLNALQPLRFFGFFWEISMSHDYLNYPMEMDTNYEKFLKKIEESNHLQDTILIILSDHGIRWGDIRLTKQGRLEERLPFVHILLPESFKENYSLAYENLKSNSHRLTTPFDIHMTLNDLVDINSISNSEILSRSKVPHSDYQKISLFLPIPSNRTCAMAGIDDHWCTCTKGAKHSVDSKEALEASRHLLSAINSLLAGHSQCSKLEIKEIIEVTELSVGKPDEDEVGWREFMVVLKAWPGDGVFEATLRNNTETGRWSLAGAASRLNLYGDQSRCVHDFRLKLYCYCH